MVKMKTSTAFDMCSLFCALIVCTLVSTARTDNTSSVAPVLPLFNSSEIEVITPESEDWESTHVPATTTITNEKYGSKTTLGTESVTGPNILQYSNKSVANDVIDKSTKMENDYHPTDKETYSSTEPIPTTNVTQSLEQPPTRAQLPSTTLIAILKNGSTTTPGTPAVTDLTFKPPEDVIGNPPSQPKPKNGYGPSHKKYSSTEPIPANEHTQSTPKKQVITVVTMRSKNKYPLLGPISSILANKEKPTRYTTTEWIKPTNKNCNCVFGKNYLKHCNHSKEEITTAKMLSQKEVYYRREQQRLMRETTTINIKRQLEESQKWELQRKVLEMETIRFNTILDILNT
ncbi:uncharacterized protein LOC111042870 isoform X2 [Myzus persicae]|uniref:uncharacterized protein LOC111042870 isoform X2 n=1 Tax=Myzus persicae TaxID=13164 RepID=UPI000B931A67|nr:uncharacterized protein LOC111042870 isoform X2 [Myzus persicae]